MNIEEKNANCSVRRMTLQRRVILEELERMMSHPTADEIFHRVRERIPNISLGTVYRNLEVLTQCGVISRIESAGAHMRFDSNVHAHYHVRCVRCGNLADIPDDLGEKISDVVRGSSDYQIIGHRLEFLGICPKCREV